MALASGETSRLHRVKWQEGHVAAYTLRCFLVHFEGAAKDALRTTLDNVVKIIQIRHAFWVVRARCEQHRRTLALIHRASCVTAMQASGVDAALGAQIDPYLTSVTHMLVNELPHVVVHGDLTHLNVLVTQDQGRWRFNGLIDWGDVKIGLRTHEFISPGVHMYRGDRETLAECYRGYGPAGGSRTIQLEHLMIARTIMYYADEFPTYLRAVPGADDGQDWSSIAQCVWQLCA